MKKSKSKMPPARSWIEASFQKRECCTFISSPKDDYVCQCGRIVRQHVGNIADSRNASEEWITSQHTKLLPTDAYGTIEFQGGPHPSKAQYIRIADDTKPELLLQLFSREWNMELPKLLITVHGGRANFELQPKLKKVLRKGLFKAAKTTGAWIFIGGTNTGVTRPVGDALISERSQRNGRVVSLGFAPWGIVEKNNELIGIGKDVPYHSISSPRSTYSALDNRLAYFLLVDDGTHGKYGCELVLRRELELFLSKQRLYPHTHSSVPVVCLIIEGGTNAIRVALEYVTDDPPVPVVVFDGSGRAADLLAFVHKYASEFKDPITLSETKEYLLNTIQQSLEVTPEHAECLYEELLQCAAHRNLITIFRVSDRVDTKSQELDQIILTALFKAQHLTPTEQLSLALTWNRVDIARSEIFIYGQEWPKGALEEAMMHALEHDRLDFVKLLMENGVSMRKFLSIPRLEELYNTKQGPSTTLGYILRDIRPHIPIGYSYTLHDIGLVINKLMGGAYKAFYTKRRFRPIYAKVMSKASQIHRNSTAFVKHYGNAMSLLTESLPAVQLSSFDCPFNELLIWAVLMKRQKMAILMFQHGEEALAKALVACKLYKAMAHEAAEDDMETEVYEELRNYGKEFEQIALELLDFCYREDDDTAQQLLTCELQNWSGQTCLSLAVSANHRALLAHPCSQVILADLWMGGLRTRKNTNLKIILGLFFPLYILQLEFKSREELQLMPQTVEEHLELENDDNDKSDSKSNLDAENCIRNMSIRSKSSTQTGVKALLFDNFIQRDTIVQENGKVMANMDEVKYNFPLEDRHYPERRSRPLKVKKRVYEFFTAPITKFWANSIAYLVFLIIFSYTVLVKMELMPSWQEFFAISYIIALGCEKIRELICSEPAGISQKFVVWIWNMWNVCDALAVLFFLVGLIFRIQENTMEVGRVMYCVNSIYWYLRILNILGVNKYLGPLVTMMGKMVKNMIYFVVLLLVVLMSFGVCRQAILFPNKEPNWHIAKDVFFEPYFMLYGEVFADGIDPSCGDTPDKPCLTGRWITPAVMAVYLLIANILLINLLIAVFNNIFNEVNSVSHQVWMFQRYTVVMEYEQKPIFPPPLILLCHVYLVLKYIKRKLGGITETYDNGLKLFLEKEDMERLYDFEEDCVEGYFAEQELKLQQSSDERIKFTAERVESIYQKVEDINTKENAQSHSMQGFDIRLRKIEGTAQDILERINSIRRCMASQGNEEIQQIVPAQIDRRRKISERSSVEVTPDWVALCGGKLSSHVEENDESPTIVANMSGSEKQLNILGEEEQRPRESISSASTDSDVLFAESYLEQRESVGRRSLESGNVFVADEAMHGSKRSLNCRQLSQTHSEPDNSEAGLATRMSTMERNVTFAEPQIKVIQPPSSSAKSRNILLAMHAEYTSITDELESMCELLSAPKTSSLLSPPCPLQSAPNHVPRRRCTSELSNPEQALFIEKERLRDAEESDYYLMKRLIKRKHDEEREAEENRLKSPLLLSVCQESKEHQGHILRRERAIDDDISIPTHETIGFSEHSAKRQDSTDSTTTNDMIPLIDQKLVQRPSIVMDSSQLPIQKEIVEKAESNTSLRMQSETMC